MSSEDIASENEYPNLNYPNFVEIENKILEFWEENKINTKIKESNKGKQPFVFLEGPPTANVLS